VAGFNELEADMIHVDGNAMYRHKKYLMYHDDIITGFRTLTIFTIRKKYSATSHICIQYVTHVRLADTKKVITSFNRAEILVPTSGNVSDIIFLELSDDEFNNNVLANII
jgi:hypothetical protein